jgi:hypothetical protein
MTLELNMATIVHYSHLHCICRTNSSWKIFLDGPIGEARDIADRVELRDPNEEFMESYRQVYELKVHAGHPANLGHGPRERLPAFLAQPLLVM